jgi:hypothetical protein
MGRRHISSCKPVLDRSLQKVSYSMLWHRRFACIVASTAVTTFDRPRASREERWRITSDRFNTDSCHNGEAYLLYTSFHVYECVKRALSRRIVQARCRSHVPSGCVSGFVVGLLQGWRRKRRAVAWCWGNCRLIASARRRVPAHGVERTETCVAVRFSCRLAVENVG